ncbi:PREDICTED: L-type lectin-domain containing receptor kinase VIII.1 [Tarenaya hassleriana]|uniref:L-type lectin-domain containing receptor kinase VIII.1 n=1 Tax=Tarenaya hassleriana TaxID=28532 RepID=UPI00053C2F0C|nr:PREDICTED: L-type lectin-domain containing receptor kinase VIII.1 [Tarenaya hassleriana]
MLSSPPSLLFSVSFFLLCFCHFHGVSAFAGTEFDFGTLTLTNLKLLGDAHLSNGSVRLTRDVSVPYSGAGKAFYSKPVRFRQPGTHSPASFSTFFSFSVTNLNPSSIGGGLAFVIPPDADTIGFSGGSLGLARADGSGSGFVAVEFDTLMDVQFKDINGNHVGFDVDGVISSVTGDLAAVEVDLKSGNTVNSWIEYDGSGRIFNVSVSYSNLKPKSPILSFPFDLDRYVNDLMYVGFSGSTQGSTEMHSIEWWSFSSSSGSGPGSDSLQPPPPATANLVNPTANSVKTSPPPPSPSPPSPAANSTSGSKSETAKPSSSCHNELCKENPGAVAGVVTAGAFFLAIFAGVLIWVYSKKFKRIEKSETFASEIIKTPKEFTYKELKTSTRNFSGNRIIGHGAFGTVYKGIFPETGEIVAVKRCSHSSQGKTEFMSELSIIGSLRHRNLVRLQGWCHEKGEILLVYDLMPNGSLDKGLFESRTPLSWDHRKKILLGVASALAYLHRECENQVIHRDVKTSNIMLDEHFNARLGDFGLARQIEHDKTPDVTVAAGTMGYLAPEYLLTGRATEKTDVFSYGAVVLEVVTGKRPIEKDVAAGNGNLVEWVWGLYREGMVLEAVDPRLEGEFDQAEVARVVTLGLACSHPDPTARPTMRAVVQMLVGEADVPLVPKTRPTLSFSTSHLLLSLQDSLSDSNVVAGGISSPSSSSWSAPEFSVSTTRGDDRLV